MENMRSVAEQKVREGVKGKTTSSYAHNAVVNSNHHLMLNGYFYYTNALEPG